MEDSRKELVSEIADFKMPDFEHIPAVGLYLEQTVTFLNEYLAPLNGTQLTGSMVSNYVKKHLISSPVRKLYSRDQIAYLFFIAVSKTVLPLTDLRLLVEIQRRTYATQTAYEYFTEELENALHYVFGLKDRLDSPGHDDTEEKQMLDSIILAAAYKVYLDKYFVLLHGESGN